MKLYRCDIYDVDEGVCVSWHASKAEAEKYLREQQHQRGEPAQGPEGVEAVEVPTDKAGLIEWLNANFTRENG